MMASMLSSAFLRPSRMCARSSRLPQLKSGSSAHHIKAMLDEILEHLLKIQDSGLAIDDGEHDDAEAGLHLGLLVEVVEDDLRLARRASIR